MDIGRSFTYVTEDQDWLQKVLIAALISLIPIVGQLYMLGYALQVTKNTIEEQIVSLHRHKRDLADSVLEGGEISGKINADELLNLIRLG